MNTSDVSTHERTARRARDWGVWLPGRPGPFNAITDVAGVEVGHVTLIEGDNVRTGVTAILPAGQAGSGDLALPAGWFSLNGNGELTGTTWISESGCLSTPILLTNTHSVGAVHEGAIRWLRRFHDGSRARFRLPVVGETCDAGLNDIDGLHVRPEHAVQAIEAASSGPVAEGNVGGSTGMTTYQYKGGAGTSSRRVGVRDAEYTVGVYVQSNFGRRQEFMINGVRLGDLGDPPATVEAPEPEPGAGSIIAIVVTDAPLLPHQCQALARRVPMGLARTGANAGHFSGDIFLAFSTANAGVLDSWTGSEESALELRTAQVLPPGLVTPLYGAVIEATEEAVINALFGAEDMTGFRGQRVNAIPQQAVAERLAAARPPLVSGFSDSVRTPDSPGARDQHQADTE
ncbi:DmpA family aminopeptidase [Nakamurella lactea]|uniref:DmpA family aminopeptidase n=1 Tax=Nakamurella lactea TaxID=459515 RepID=UPI0009FD832D|nr:P1 family peptidase [Nakamurella lactea]